MKRDGGGLKAEDSRDLNFQFRPSDSPVALFPPFVRVTHDYCRLIRCEDAVDEGVLCQFRRCVKIELHHDLRFMKLDCLR